MTPDQIIANIRESGWIMWFLWGIAIYALIVEWIASSRYEAACRTCSVCEQKRKDAAQARNVEHAKRTGRCPKDGFALDKGMTCPACRKTWT